jgi:SAM-dependent methyltransferase
MKPGLLDLLVCPHDARELSFSGDDELTCADGHRFPIREEVPRLVPAESGPLGDQTGTFDSFSAKWSRVDGEEVRQRVDAQYAWYVERFGFGDEDGLARFLAGKRTVLEAGTGLGGDAARFARLSDATVIGLDLSESIVTAQREFGAAENLHYIQADLLRPPLPAGRFDFVSADQVVHHTPDAEAAVHSLARLLTPGGVLAFYVYKV